VGGAGALILGHAHPAVVAAAQEQAARGMHMFGVLNDVAVHLARRLVDEIPCAERIAYATTGSEATAYAMRLARAFTGRDKVMKFEGAYHGNHDYALVSTFPSHPANYPDGQADTCGQPEATRSTMMVAPYNDAETVEKLVKEHKGEIAAIIVECVQRIIPAEPGFLRALRRICDDNDIVLVFDEVVTGFRLAPGGGQDYFGVTPDLATYGKVVGGSGPLSCVAGRAEIVDLADPARKGQMDFAYFNGTLHGNPVAAAATLATLDELARPGTHDRLNAYADDFCREAQKVLDANGVRAIACNTGSLWQILFVAARPRNQADMLAGDAAAMRRLDTELLKRGQYNIPGVRRFFSLAHGEREMEETLKALDASCRALA
jgi:glutamate-1-semialdehyde 2,1-aminomutase